MNRYTYTPNLLLNKRLTPLLSPSGRNPSLHPRIISHIGRYTKEKERERAKRREGRKGQRREGGEGGEHGVKNAWGHSSVLVGGQAKSHARQNRDQRIMCSCACVKDNTHTHTQ